MRVIIRDSGDNSCFKLLLLSRIPGSVIKLDFVDADFLSVDLFKKETYMFVGLFCINQQGKKDAFTKSKFMIEPGIIQILFFDSGHKILIPVMIAAPIKKRGTCMQSTKSDAPKTKVLTSSYSSTKLFTFVTRKASSSAK